MGRVVKRARFLSVREQLPSERNIVPELGAGRERPDERAEAEAGPRSGKCPPGAEAGMRSAVSQWPIRRWRSIV